MNNIQPLKNDLYIPGIYFWVSSAVAILAQLIGIVFPGLLLQEPLTGGLVFWTHLHTMGVITPFFIGMGFYFLNTRYNIKYKKSIIVGQMLVMYGSLLSFLYFVSSREGSNALTISAGLLFGSGVYFLFLYSKGLFKYGWGKKENRNFEFWIDAASLYFFLQLILFGFVLAANLNYHFLKRSELHSLRLHSHSGITGFWLLQTINLIYRSVTRINSDNHRFDRYIHLSATSMASGLFLWTSVHDRFEAFLYIYYFLAGVSLTFLLIYVVRVKTSGSGLKEIFLTVACFMITAYLLAGFLIFYHGDAMIYEHHIPFVYIFMVFYGVFILLPLPFLIAHDEVSDDQGKSLWKYLKWPWRTFLIIEVWFVLTMVLEMKIAMSIVLGLMLAVYIVMLNRIMKLSSNH